MVRVAPCVASLIHRLHWTATFTRACIFICTRAKMFARPANDGNFQRMD